MEACGADPPTSTVRMRENIVLTHPLRDLLRSYHCAAKCGNCFALPVAVDEGFDYSWQRHVVALLGKHGERVCRFLNLSWTFSWRVIVTVFLENSAI